MRTAPSVLTVMAAVDPPNRSVHGTRHPRRFKGVQVGDRDGAFADRPQPEVLVVAQVAHPAAGVLHLDAASTAGPQR